MNDWLMIIPHSRRNVEFDWTLIQETNCWIKTSIQHYFTNKATSMCWIGSTDKLLLYLRQYILVSTLAYWFYRQYVRVSTLAYWF